MQYAVCSQQFVVRSVVTNHAPRCSQVLDNTFDDDGTPMMVPPAGPERERASKLLGLERELFGA